MLAKLGSLALRRVSSWTPSVESGPFGAALMKGVHRRPEVVPSVRLGQRTNGTTSPAPSRPAWLQVLAFCETRANTRGQCKRERLVPAGSSRVTTWKLETHDLYIHHELPLAGLDFIAASPCRVPRSRRGRREGPSGPMGLPSSQDRGADPNPPNDPSGPPHSQKQ